MLEIRQTTWLSAGRRERGTDSGIQSPTTGSPLLAPQIRIELMAS